MSVAAVERVAEISAMVTRLTGADAAPAAGFDAQLAAASGATAGGSAGPGGVAALQAPGTSGAPVNGVPYANEINAAAARHKLDPALLTALIKQESGFNPKAGSPAGAQGLCQLMPGTARSLGVNDVHDPVQNIEGGAKYLRRQLDAFGGNVEKALAAYNAGPGAVSKFGGIPPYPETQSYVKKVTAYAEEYRRQGVGAAAASPTGGLSPAVAAASPTGGLSPAALLSPAPPLTAAGAAASPSTAGAPTAAVSAGGPPTSPMPGSPGAASIV